VDGFSCGNAVLDKWLISSALDADRSGTARTFVWADRDRVVAYFSLCPHEVRRDNLPPKVGRGSPNAVPAILLARLARHIDLAERHLGGQLLIDALSRAVAAVEAAGGRVIVVDAVDDQAISFYGNFGFTRAPVPYRLVMKASDARASLS
jgi:predicted N-acetyltransferase YhbS